MKKKAKKLSLSRETLHHLQRTQLSRVAGGSATHEVMTGCACTDTCNTDCGGCGTGTGTGTGGSADACTTGQTFEIISGCATNCG
jgi:hypothetical protein